MNRIVVAAAAKGILLAAGVIHRQLHPEASVLYGTIADPGAVVARDRVVHVIAKDGVVGRGDAHNRRSAKVVHGRSDIVPGPELNDAAGLAVLETHVVCAGQAEIVDGIVGTVAAEDVETPIVHPRVVSSVIVSSVVHEVEEQRVSIPRRIDTNVQCARCVVGKVVCIGLIAAVSCISSIVATDYSVIVDVLRASL